jgi:hypothetical protein
MPMTNWDTPTGLAGPNNPTVGGLRDRSTLFLDRRGYGPPLDPTGPLPEPTDQDRPRAGRDSDANWMRLNCALLRAGVPPTPTDSHTLHQLAQADPVVVDTVIRWLEVHETPPPSDPRLHYAQHG